MPERQTCLGCGWPYPADLINPFHTNVFRAATPVCGICALVLSNVIHGATRLGFDGMAAENGRRAAVAWRKAHPELEPKPKPAARA